MKISKLFHWLYAFLMFLPITFILPTLAYYGFNDNAISQEYTKEEPVYYESNEVNSVSDLVLGNSYQWLDNNPFTSVEGIDTLVIDITDELYYSFFPTFTRLDTDTFVVQTYSSGIRLKLYHNGIWVSNANMNDSQFAFVLISIYNVNNAVNLVSSIGYYDHYIKEYQNVTYTMGITESVNQAIIDTFDLPMFAWATNNILVAPFSSICSFFGIASTSVLIKYLYYWLTISVIWLVFDVLMYIPLLVHNYIDKARIE